MKIVEELNKLIEEALEEVLSTMENNCKELGFKLTDQHKLKDGTGRIVFVKYEKNEDTNYSHEISLRLQTGELRYVIRQEDKQDSLSWQNINTVESLENAFKEIRNKYEGVE